MDLEKEPPLTALLTGELAKGWSGAAFTSLHIATVLCNDTAVAWLLQYVHKVDLLVDPQDMTESGPGLDD